VTIATHTGLAAELCVSDLARSLAFYADLLEFRVACERPEDRFAAISLGSALAAAGWVAPAALHEKSYRAGGRTLRVRQLVVADPDGYLIRPSQRLPPLGGPA
jgi:catechol 2,3-dioxygenase-like lactoylglutathione lyase family enzyme